MPDETQNPQPVGVLADVEASLEALESSLTAAGSAGGALRASLSKVAVLARTVDEIEAVLANARHQLAPLPPPSAFSQDAAGSDPAPEIATPTSAAEASPESYCLLLELTMRRGTLDLKTVDSAVNEHDAVVDVALLDYDGNRASLQVWVDPAADPGVVREALLESLDERFADAGGAEVRIELDARPAA
jgi:hypothetical protein